MLLPIRKKNRRITLLGAAGTAPQVVRDGDDVDVWLRGETAVQDQPFNILAPSMKVGVFFLLVVSCKASEHICQSIY